MNAAAKEQIDLYYSLRQEIDELSNKLSSEYHNHLQCKKGCDQCCVNLNILPVEYYAILNELSPEEIPDISTITNREDPCTFLQDHACTIYPSRPVICRTHGLPMLFLNDEGDDMELAYCELNFTNAEDLEFTTENTYPEDHYMSKLYQINREFVKHFKKRQFHEQQIIPLTGILTEGK